MRRYAKHVVLAALLTFAAACDFDSHENHEGAPIPPPDSHKLTLTAIDAVNKDTGQVVEVDGLPVPGGELLED